MDVQLSLQQDSMGRNDNLQGSNRRPKVIPTNDPFEDVTIKMSETPKIAERPSMDITVT